MGMIVLDPGYCLSFFFTKLGYKIFEHISGTNLTN